MKYIVFRIHNISEAKLAGGGRRGRAKEGEKGQDGGVRIIYNRRNATVNIL